MSPPPRPTPSVFVSPQPPPPPPPIPSQAACAHTTQSHVPSADLNIDSNIDSHTNRPTLRAVPSTLLIPLVARAYGDGYFSHLACADAHAFGLLQRLCAAYPERDIAADICAYQADRPTILNILWRTRRIRTAAHDFFIKHHNAWGINIGCGLSHYFQWLDNNQNTWVDADLPEVMALRRAFLTQRQPRLRQAILDIQSPQWWSALALPHTALSQPILAVCEGVLMYLQPAQAHAVLAQFACQAPVGSRLWIDVLSYCAVGRAGLHASVRRTGAQFQWGLRQSQELDHIHPRLRLRTLHSVAECYGWMGMTLEALWRPWCAAPLYGLAELEVIN